MLSGADWLITGVLNEKYSPLPTKSDLVGLSTTISFRFHSIFKKSKMVAVSSKFKPSRRRIWGIRAYLNSRHQYESIHTKMSLLAILSRSKPNMPELTVNTIIPCRLVLEL